MNEHHELLICSLQQSVDKLSAQIAMNSKLIQSMQSDVVQLKIHQGQYLNRHTQMIESTHTAFEALGRQINYIIDMFSQLFAKVIQK